VAQLPEMPGYATIVQPAESAQKPKRSKKKLVLLSLLIVLLLGAAGTFSTLWIIERNAHQSASDELNAKRKALTESETYGKTVQGQLDRSRSEQYDLQSELKELRQEKAAADAERAKGGGSK